MIKKIWERLTNQDKINRLESDLVDAKNKSTSFEYDLIKAKKETEVLWASLLKPEEDLIRESIDILQKYEALKTHDLGHAQRQLGSALGMQNIAAQQRQLHRPYGLLGSMFN